MDSQQNREEILHGGFFVTLKYILLLPKSGNWCLNWKKHLLDFKRNTAITCHRN
jgi:hypothetical protein